MKYRERDRHSHINYLCWVREDTHVQTHREKKLREREMSEMDREIRDTERREWEIKKGSICREKRE